MKIPEYVSGFIGSFCGVVLIDSVIKIYKNNTKFNKKKNSRHNYKNNIFKYRCEACHQGFDELDDLIKHLKKNKDLFANSNGFVYDGYYYPQGMFNTDEWWVEKIPIGGYIELHFAGSPSERLIKPFAYSNGSPVYRLVDAENYFSTVNDGNNVRITVEGKNGKRMTFDNARYYSPYHYNV